MKKYLKKLSLLFTLAMVLMVSCSKEDSAKTPEIVTALVLMDNVKIIDATELELDLTPSKIDNGIYEFSFSGASPDIKLGDIIVGEQGDGFIRKVSSAAVNGNSIVLQTTQGTMSDVFQEGGFNFNLDMTDMKARGPSGFSYTITNKTLYEEGALSIVLNNTQVDFDPNWFLDFNFDKKGITSFEMSAQNGTLNGNFTATVTASQAITLLNKSSSILPNGKPYSKSYTKRVPATLLGFPVLVPVTVVMNLDLVLDYSAIINAAITRQATFTSNNKFNLGLNYSNGKWNDINSFSPSNNFSLSKRTGNANATINLSLTPKVSFKLYGQAGPYASVGLMEQLSSSVASPALDWDFKADVWIKSTAGASVAILDYSLADYSKTWETAKLSYLTPYKIEKVSGDNQKGNFGQQLISPLKVKVLDNLDKPQSNIPVYFKIVDGGGTVQTTSVLTDDNGFAETQWTLGSSATQTVNVSAKKANGTLLLNAPLTFSATSTVSSCDDTTVPYSTVTIGSQIWMQKNLNVCKYRNGDDIPQVQDPTAWSKLTTGAWCYRENKTANGLIYGKLYNWYAVNDPRGLAPADYHIPSDAEWNTLITFLGGRDVAGGKMKATGTSLWTSPNTDATNSSGFTGLPGRLRFYDGSFSYSDYNDGYWWSASERGDIASSWNYELDSQDGSVLRDDDLKTYGYSVRCVKD